MKRPQLLFVRVYFYAINLEPVNFEVCFSSMVTHSVLPVANLIFPPSFADLERERLCKEGERESFAKGRYST